MGMVKDRQVQFAYFHRESGSEVQAVEFGGRSGDIFPLQPWNQVDAPPDVDVVAGTVTVVQGGESWTANRGDWIYKLEGRLYRSDAEVFQREFEAV